MICCIAANHCSIAQTATLISLTRYRALLRKREVARTLLASFVGRLPIGITGLAILFLVQSSSGSFARSGAASGFYRAGLAAVAPAWGRWMDRAGPAWPLRITGGLFPLALLALVLAANRNSVAGVCLFALVSGASFPPITACMRAFLRQKLSHEESLLATAYSLDSVLIELVFILGPMAVAFFVAWASAASAVLFSAGCAVLGTFHFIRSPALRAWKIEQRAPARLFGPLAERPFLALIAVIFCYSGAFGLLEIGVTAYATELGKPALGGVLLAVTSVGSAIGGLAYGSRHWHLPLNVQFAGFLGTMALGLGALSLASSPIVFATCCALAGFVMAPALIVQSMLVTRTASAQYTAEAFTWPASALLTGVGAGLALGGGLLALQPSNAVLGLGSGCALVAAFGARLALRR